MQKITLLLASIVFSFSAYSQNTCATAQVATPGTTTVTAINGNEVPAPDCAGAGAPTSGEWFTFTSTTEGVVTITTDLPANTGRDTRLHVYTGACGALSCLIGSDNVDSTNFNYLSEVEFLAEVGITYTFAFDDRWEATGFDFQLTFTTITCTYTVPYAETFDDNSKFLVCYEKEDLDGDNFSWISQQDIDLDGDGTPEYFATNSSTSTPKNDWLIGPALTLIGGTSYTLTSVFNTFGNTANGSLEAFILDAPNSSANQIATLFSNTNITQQGVAATLETSAYQEGNDFIPSTTGNYYVAYRSFGPAGSGFVLLFDSNLDITLSTQEFENNTITHYYNSDTNNLEINSSNLVFSSIEIFNILGKQILSKKLNTAQESIALETIQDGVYIAKVNTLNGIKTIKFVKN